MSLHFIPSKYVPEKLHLINIVININLLRLGIKTNRVVLTCCRLLQLTKVRLVQMQRKNICPCPFNKSQKCMKMQQVLIFSGTCCTCEARLSNSQQIGLSGLFSSTKYGLIRIEQFCSTYSNIVRSALCTQKVHMKQGIFYTKCRCGNRLHHKLITQRNDRHCFNIIKFEMICNLNEKYTRLSGVKHAQFSAVQFSLWRVNGDSVLIRVSVAQITALVNISLHFNSIKDLSIDLRKYTLYQ